MFNKFPGNIKTSSGPHMSSSSGLLAIR